MAVLVAFTITTTKNIVRCEAGYWWEAWGHGGPFPSPKSGTSLDYMYIFLRGSGSMQVFFWGGGGIVCLCKYEHCMSVPRVIKSNLRNLGDWPTLGDCPRRPLPEPPVHTRCGCHKYGSVLCDRNQQRAINKQACLPSVCRASD